MLLGITMLLWLFEPAWGETFLWLTGSCNYLWTTVIVLVEILVYRIHAANPDKIKDNNIIACCMFIFGIIAGWTNENTAIALIFINVLFLIYYKINNIKIPKWSISCLVGSIIGGAILLLAPGNYVRASKVEGDSLVIRFINITKTLRKNEIVLYVIGLFLLILNRKDKNVFLIALMFCLTSLVATYSMIASPEFPSRSWTSSIIFMIICLGILFTNIDFSYDKSLKLLILGMCILSIVFIRDFISGVKAINTVSEEWNERIDQINVAIENNEKEVELERISAKGNKHVAQYGLRDLQSDETDWPNTSMAKYYGIEKIIVKEEE